MSDNFSFMRSVAASLARNSVSTAARSLLVFSRAAFSLFSFSMSCFACWLFANAVVSYLVDVSSTC